MLTIRSAHFVSQDCGMTTDLLCYKMEISTLAIRDCVTFWARTRVLSTAGIRRDVWVWRGYQPGAQLVNRPLAAGPDVASEQKPVCGVSNCLWLDACHAVPLTSFQLGH